MSNIILTTDNFGHNTFYIADAMKDTKRVKSGEYDKADPPDWVIRWGCTASIGPKIKVINKRRAIRNTVNKGTFRHLVAQHGWAPKTWLSRADWAMDTLFGGKGASLPVVIRPQFHQRSENLYFATNTDEVKKATEAIDGDLYISQYIEKQKEYRAFVAGGRVMIMAEKIPVDRDEVSWGCVERGELEYMAWSDWLPEVAQCAVEAFNLSELDFAAVDIMWKDGKAYFLECNTAPEVWRYYGECFAKVFEYVMDGDKRGNIPVKDYTTWKNYIHPAISDKAVI